jgi:hypothetical protein
MTADVLADERALRDAAAAALGEEPGAGIAWDARTTYRRYPAPFVRHTLWSLDYRGPHHPVFLFLAWAPGSAACVLTGHPEVFADTLRADGSDIRSPEQAIQFARAFVTTTRDPDHAFTVVTSVHEVPSVPHPTAGERSRLEAFRDRYSNVVQPPAALEAGTGYAVVLFVTRNQRLERVRVSLEPGGHVTLSAEVLETALPLVST